MARSIVQEKTCFAASGTNTLEATFDATATLDNLLLYCAALDKNAGTFTLTGFDQAVYLTSSNVSLLIAWAVAAGTETLISGTWTGANSGGSNGYIAEIEDDDSTEAWTETATPGTSADSGATVTTKSSGTSGTIAAPGGLAIAAHAVDSVNTSPAVAYSNGYTGVRSMADGGNEAGLWVAILDIATGGGTTETTIDRDPLVSGTVTADQMVGGLIVVSRGEVVVPPDPGPRVPERIARPLRTMLVR